VVAVVVGAEISSSGPRHFLFPTASPHLLPIPLFVTQGGLAARVPNAG
jgi:hypothetical protein